MTFPEGDVCRRRENILRLANMIGRKKSGVKPGDKGSCQRDDSEYVILEAGVEFTKLKPVAVRQILKRKGRIAVKKIRRAFGAKQRKPV